MNAARDVADIFLSLSPPSFPQTNDGEGTSGRRLFLNEIGDRP